MKAHDKASATQLVGHVNESKGWLGFRLYCQLNNIKRDIGYRQVSAVLSVSSR